MNHIFVCIKLLNLPVFLVNLLWANGVNGKIIYKWERRERMRILDHIDVMSKICDPFPLS